MAERRNPRRPASFQLLPAVCVSHLKPDDNFHESIPLNPKNGLSTIDSLHSSRFWAFQMFPDQVNHSARVRDSIVNGGFGTNDQDDNGHRGVNLDKNFMSPGSGKYSTPRRAREQH
jgi:hypothetical protein